MKDLITTIGAIMILMVFVMQFCSNQVLATRILVADYIIDDYESINIEDSNSVETKKKELAECFACQPNEIVFRKNEDKITIEMPIKNVIACGDFLGISEAENKSIYTREILLK